MRYVIGALLIAACSREPAAPAPVPPPLRPAPVARVAVAADPRAPLRAAAHDVLARRCGECHERHRSTAKPGALAAFDLDAADWPAKFDKRTFASAMKRLASAPAEDTSKFVAFRDAELAARR